MQDGSAPAAMQSVYKSAAGLLLLVGSTLSNVLIVLALTDTVQTKVQCSLPDDETLAREQPRLQS